MCGVSVNSTSYGLSSESMNSEAALASKGGIREQPEVTQARFPLLNQRTISGEEFSHCHCRLHLDLPQRLIPAAIRLVSGTMLQTVPFMGRALSGIC